MVYGIGTRFHRPFIYCDREQINKELLAQDDLPPIIIPFRRKVSFGFIPINTYNQLWVRRVS